MRKLSIKLFSNFAFQQVRSYTDKICDEGLRFQSEYWKMVDLTLILTFLDDDSNFISWMAPIEHGRGSLLFYMVICLMSKSISPKIDNFMDLDLIWAKLLG